MAEEKVTTSAAETKTWKRRGLLAAAWTAVAAIVAKQTSQPVEAGVDGDVVAGATTTATQATTLRNNLVPADVTQAPQALVCQRGSEGPFSIKAYFLDAALIADTDRSGGYGVWCLSTGPDGAALLATTTGLNSIGVDSRASSVAVRGQITNGSSANTIAVYGANNSPDLGPVPGAGGFGVYGFSKRGHGIVGAAATAGAAGVVGATNGVAGAHAAVFFGPVVATEGFTVFGAKSAAVPHPDGLHRRLYCMESPESWFEDFGKDQLQCGQADVTLDPGFAAVVHLDDYHVFLTPYGLDALGVTRQTPQGFHVETKDATSSSRFSWRVVAKRKDIVGERLATIEIPPEPQLPRPTPDGPDIATGRNYRQ